jgi:carbamoyltransferase
VASAFYPSPFPEAAVVVVDGGSGIATVVATGTDRGITLRHRLADPHSLSLFIAAFTEFLGFHPETGAHAVIGLVAHGQPRFRELIAGNLVRWLDHGLFALNPCFLRFDGRLPLTTPMLKELLGLRPRLADEPVRQQHRDLAASVQAVFGDALLRLARAATDETGAKDLCLGGAMALNPIANGRLLREGGFRRIWVQPAAGEAAGAVGAAFSVYHRDLQRPRTCDPGIDGMAGGLLGPDIAEAEIGGQLDRLGARYCRLGEDAMLDAVVEALAVGQIVGWFQGAMEFGPHSLGARSILADPRLGGLRRYLDSATPPREPARPFVAAVLRDAVADWFAFDHDSPYGLFTAPVQDHRAAQIAAAIGADGTVRLQTIDARQQPRFHRLLCRFRQMTGCPVLLHTGFRLGEGPSVATPEDAFHGLRATAIDVLACGSYVLRKDEQAAEPVRDFPRAPRTEV